MGKYEFHDHIQKIANKAGTYGWTPHLFVDLRKVAQSVEPHTFREYFETRTNDTFTPKEVHIILISLMNIVEKPDYMRLSSLVHHSLKDRLMSNDMYFLIYALLSDNRIPLPRSLVYDITERLLLNIEFMYKKIVRDFRKVPSQNTEKVILFLTLQYCRKDLNTQNKEMVGLILSHIKTDVPSALKNDVKEFLVRTFLTEISETGDDVQIDRKVYNELKNYKTEGEKSLGEKTPRAREGEQSKAVLEKGPQQGLEEEILEKEKSRSQDEKTSTNKRVKEENKTHKPGHLHDLSGRLDEHRRNAKENESKNRENFTRQHQESYDSKTPISEKKKEDTSASSFREEGKPPSAADESPREEISQEESPSRKSLKASAPQNTSFIPDYEKNEEAGEDESSPVPSPIEDSFSDSRASDTASDLMSRSLSNSSGNSSSSQAQQQPDDKFHFTYEQLQEELAQGIQLKDLDIQGLIEEEKSEEGEESTSEPFQDQQEEPFPAPLDNEKPSPASQEPQEVSLPAPQDHDEEPSISIAHEQEKETNEPEESNIQETKKKKRKRKVILIAAGIVAAILLFFLVFSPFNGNREGSSQKTLPPTEDRGTTGSEGSSSSAQSPSPDSSPSQTGESSNEPQNFIEQTSAETNTSSQAGSSTGGGVEAPQGSETLVLSSGGMEHTFFVEEENTIWQAEEGDHFYMLYSFIQDFEGEAPPFVAKIKSISWQAFYGNVQRYNPGIEDMDLIYPEGNYTIFEAE